MRLAGAAALVLALAGPGAAAEIVRVGSKSFTESYVLAEIAAQALERAGGTVVERRLGLGGTGITFGALAQGSIDVYPEYTGTLSRAVLGDPDAQSVEAIRAALRPRGVTISDPLGFDNTYALGVRAEAASRLGLARISDLRRHPHLAAAFSAGFLERDDGWPGLRRRYGLQLRDVRVIEHALAYQALTTGTVDVIDIFSTDGRLTRPGIVALQDDSGFFPAYAAVLAARLDFVERAPAAWAALQRAMVGRIDARTMATLNAAADLDGQSVRGIAAGFLGAAAAPDDGRAVLTRELVTLTVDHLALVLVAVGAAAAAGLPLGILAARSVTLGRIELMVVGMLQTVPALALLCFMIPLLGIGKLPSLVALFLYALLPIVRSTFTGLVTLDRQLLEIAGVLGVDGWRRLARIELPLASVSIMSGIRTSAILTVGTATLAAFIGGGGYGTLIVRGLALNDVRTILAGAVPAAVMALLVDALFEAADRVLVPRGLRLTLVRPGQAPGARAAG